MVEDDLDDVLEKPRSLSNDGQCSDVNDKKLRDAGCELHCCCIRAGYHSGPVAQLVLKGGNVCGKGTSCQATPSVRDACVGTYVRTVSRGTQAETNDDLEARVRKACEAKLTPELERAEEAAK
eukprot:3458094-Prymnesium_polylepis.1